MAQNDTVTSLAAAGFQLPQRQMSMASQVEESIRLRLRDGTFAPGDQLPTENELAEALDVSRATVRTAVGSLVRRGQIVRRHGVGTFIAAGTMLRNDLSEVVDFNILIERTGASAGVIFDEISIGKPSKLVASALKLDTSDQVLTSAKRFTADDLTVIYVLHAIPVSVLGMSIATDALIVPQSTEPLFAFLEDAVGISTAFVLASIKAELGSAIGYPGAVVEPDSPMLRFDEVAFTNENTPIWHSQNWFPPGEMTFDLIRQTQGAGH